MPEERPATIAEEVLIHPFQKAGLGKAPFRYVGMEEKVFVACPGATPKAGGTCDYCCQGIRYVFYVVSSDGKKSGVGCECINKCCGPKLVAAVKSAERLRKREAKDERDAARIGAARERFPAVRDVLAKQPHPNEWHAGRGATLADWCEWMLKNAGVSGRLDAARVIEKAASAVLPNTSGPGCPTPAESEQQDE